MRIDNLNRTSASQGAEQSGQTAQERAAAKEAAAGPDQVEVSHLAQSLSLATTDPGRIEQLRLQVESGSYNVSASAIATSVIDFHFKE